MSSRRNRLCPFGLAIILSMFPGCVMSDHVEIAVGPLDLAGVRVDPRNSSPVILLREPDGQRRELPIWIGACEARSIALGMEKASLPRPNTHDLIESLLGELQGHMSRVVVTELRGTTYHARIDIEVGGGRTVSVDSRPSDAIAIAVRTDTPIYATDAVLDRSHEDPDSGRPLDVRWESPSCCVDSATLAQAKCAFIPSA